jgi:hypothetical protein
MQVWQAALWGLAGGFCMELWTLHGLARQPAFSLRCPIPQGLTAFVTAVLTKLAISTIVAAAAAGEVTGVWVTFGLGVAAPVVLQRLAAEVPLAGGEQLRPLPEAAHELQRDGRKEPQPVAGAGDGDGDPG